MPAVKPFAVTVSAVLLTLGCLTTSPAVASHPYQPPKRCPGQRRGHGPPARCPVTVFDVADGSVPPGSTAQLTATVTAVATSGRRAWLGVSPDDPDYTGWEYSGLEVGLPRCLHRARIEVGDQVEISGTVASAANGRRLDTEALRVESHGEAVEPLEIPDTALLSPAEPGALDSVLVRVPQLTIATASPNEMTMTDGLTLGNAIIGELPTNYSGTFEFEWVTGIADTLGAGPRLLPREIGDLHIGD